MTEDARWMRLALSLGARGQGRTWPNPAVGCVVVKDGRVAGRGWTQPGGRPHAEVVALRQAGADAFGATVFVSLEPCGHTGQTGPCAQALAEAGVARVVVAVGDPDDRVAGQGFEILRNAGIEVVSGVLEDRARTAHAGFFNRIRTGRPAVTLKLASSLDGRIATGSGDSRWITGPEARRMVHFLRATHDAVMVGSGTALTDNPDLRVRDLGIADQPVRVVLDSRLRMPPDSRLARSAAEHPVWIVHGEQVRKDRVEALRSTGCQLFPCRSTTSGIDLPQALGLLGQAGLTRVLCEGGGQVAASLIANGLADRIVSFSAGLVIGAEGQPNFGALGLDGLKDAPRFRLIDSRRAGTDVVSTWAQ